MGRRRRTRLATSWAGQIEHHAWFPNRANVEFYRPLEAKRDSDAGLGARGGETLSSGGGSRAAAVAAVIAGDGPPGNCAHRWRDLVIEIDDELTYPHDRPGRARARGTFDPLFVAALEAL